jgi:hypothetical protein
MSRQALACERNVIAAVLSAKHRSNRTVTSQYLENT